MNNLIICFSLRWMGKIGDSGRSHGQKLEKRHRVLACNHIGSLLYISTRHEERRLRFLFILGS